MSKFYSVLAIFVIILAISACSSTPSPTFTVKVSSSATETTSKLFNIVMPATIGSTTEQKITMYAIWLSTNEDCSAPVKFVDFGDAGQEFDFNQNPTVYSGSPADGTYKCLITEMSDVMKFKVDDVAVTNWGAACENTTTEYSYDIYRRADVDTDQWVDINGDLITSTGSPAVPGFDKVYTFSSTVACNADSSLRCTTVKANGVAIHSYQYAPMASPLIAPGQTTLYMDFTDKVHADDFGDCLHPAGCCWVEQPAMGFR